MSLQCLAVVIVVISIAIGVVVDNIRLHRKVKRLQGEIDAI